VVAVSLLVPPAQGLIRVGFVISEGVNVIDLSGPWGVFESVMLNRAGEGTGSMAFELFTIAKTRDVVTSNGLQLLPNYAFDDGVVPNIIVVAAQSGSDAMREWIRKASASADLTMSVCTGAFHLARAGLLDGKAATTHHEFLDKFEQEFPAVQVRRGVRFVEGEDISSAAGLTSGTDLALRVVERYFGRHVAQSTAAYMEYQGQGWLV
jgi:transcriptional regulator GlxA family with amidase domain